MQEYLIAFAVGGTICALSQLLMDKTKLLPGRIMVIPVSYTHLRAHET